MGLGVECVAEERSRSRSVPIACVRACVLLSWLCSACSGGADKASADASVPTEYVGYVSVSPAWVDVNIQATGDGCVCPRVGPDTGDCHDHDDFGQECSECVPCLSTVTLRASGMDDSVRDWGYFGIRTMRSHTGQGAAGLTVFVDGCLGTVEMNLDVPTQGGLVVHAPTSGAGATVVAWSGADGADEFATQAQAAFSARECRIVGANSHTVGVSADSIGVVSVEARTEVGVLDTDNARVVQYSSDRAIWESDE